VPDVTETDPEHRGVAPPELPAVEPGLAQIDPDAYELLGEIARGGMGRILRARDRRLDRPVAIKQLLVSSPRLAALFEREVRLTARLQHPSIVSIHEAGVLPGGELMYVMKLVPGRALRDVLREPRTVAQRLAHLPVVIAIADALAYAHQQRVIHRDLKPGNVLVGEFGEVVVIDWGLAKELGEAPSPLEGVADALEHATAGAMGTPAYMAPEAARAEPVDQRADVYAIGAILYEALTGAPPYGGADAAAILAAVREGPPAPIEQRAPGVPYDLAAIVAKAMAREPAARYPSARELADELRRFQTGQLVSAHAYSLGERARRWLRRHRAPVVVAMAALAVVVALTWFGFARIVEQRDVAAERADRLTLARARLELDRDPAAALATLATLPARSPHWAAARVIAADAEARGVPARLDGGGVDVVAIASEGARALVGDDAAVHVRSAAGELATLGCAAPPVAIAASADGGTIAIVDAGGAVRVWSLATPAVPVLAVAGARASARVAIATDGSAIVVTGRDLGVRAWSVPGGVELWRDDAARDVEHAAIGPGGGVIVLASGERVELRGAVTRSLIAPAAVVALAVGPGGEALAIATADGGVRIEDLESGAVTMTARQDVPATALAFAASAPILVTAADRGVRLYSRDGRLVRALGGLRGPATAVAISADATEVAAADARGAWVWSGLDADQARLAGPSAAGVEVAVAGKLAVTVAEDGTVWTWSLADRAGRELGRHAAPARALAISRDGARAVTTGDDRTVRLWELAAGTGRVLGSHQGAGLAVAFAPAGDAAASGGADRAVRLFELGGDGRVLGRHAGAVLAVAFTPDGARVVSIGDEPAAMVWPRAGGAPRVVVHASAVTALAISPDGREAATGTRGGEVLRWAIDGGEPRVVARHAGPVRDLAWSPDGGRVASASDDGSALIVDASGRTVTLSGHDDFVRRVAFAPDGRAVVTAGEDGRVRLWDPSSGEGRDLGPGGAAADVAFAGGGDVVLAIGADGALWLFRDELPCDRAGLRAAIVTAAAEASP